MKEPTNVTVHTDESICFAIVETVSELTNTDPIELDPLGTVVDTDALSTLFGGSDGPTRHDAYLSFRYEGCHVSVDSDGSISVSHASPTAGMDGGVSLVGDVESVGGE